MTLNISKQNPLPTDFWGTGIRSLVCVLGDNGAGKSTALSCILNAVVAGNNTKFLDAIIVYEEDKAIKVYYPELYKIKITGGKKIGLPLSINTFYYSGQTILDQTYDDLRTVELEGMYNASDGCRIIRDLQKYANINALSLGASISSYLNAYVAQNNYRICNLLINDKLIAILKEEISLPEYIVFGVNTSAYLLYKNEMETVGTNGQIYKFLNYPAFLNSTSRNAYLAKFIHHNLLNISLDCIAANDSEKLIEDWYEVFDPSKNALDQFCKFANSRNEGHQHEILGIVYEVLSVMDKLAIYNEQSGVLYLSFKNNRDEIKQIMKSVLSNNLFLVSRYFDIYYSHDINHSRSLLSSGEQQMLDLFSRIYSSIEQNQQDKLSHRNSSLLLLDEAEIGFHPAWQRHYIDMLTMFINSLKSTNGFACQIVITSHSPILLSDIPSCCCNYLRRIRDGQTQRKTFNIETFANNVFELYRNSFYVNDGLIGKFAESKLSSVESRLIAGRCVVDNEINMIGDARLKAYFKYLQGDKQQQIAFYQEQINKLTNEGRYNEQN